MRSKLSLSIMVGAMVAMLVPSSAFAALTVGATTVTSDGALTMQADAGSAIILGSAAVAGTIAVGGTAQTGTITLGSSTQASTVRIANGSGAGTVNIANVQTGGAVSIGSAMTTGTITIGGASETGTITLGRSTGTNTINIGSATRSGATTQTINIGEEFTNIFNYDYGITAINIGTAGVYDTTKTISIGGNACISGFSQCTSRSIVNIGINNIGSTIGGGEIYIGDYNYDNSSTTLSGRVYFKGREVVNNPTAPVALADSDATPTVAQILDANIFYETPTQDRNFTLPTAQGASGLVRALPEPTPGVHSVGDTFHFVVVNNAALGSGFEIVLLAGAGSTIVGLDRVHPASSRTIYCRVTSGTTDSETISCY